MHRGQFPILGGGHWRLNPMEKSFSEITNVRGGLSEFGQSTKGTARTPELVTSNCVPSTPGALGLAHLFLQGFRDQEFIWRCLVPQTSALACQRISQIRNSLLIHDYLLTFSREVRTSLALSRMLSKHKRFKVEYVWEAPWTIVKATFLLNRYGNLIGQSVIALEETGILSHGSQEVFICFCLRHFESQSVHQFCASFNLIVGIFMILYTESIHNVVLVLVRAWAIWGCTYRVTAWLILLYAIYMLVSIGTMTYAATSADFAQFQYLDEIGVCIVPTPAWVWIPSAVTLLLDTGVFATVMCSLRKFSRDSRHLYPSPLVHLLVVQALSDVDGSHCFTGKRLQQLVFHDMLVSVFVSDVARVLTRENMTGRYIVMCLDRKQDPRGMLELALSFPLLAIVGQRLVLNLRGLQTRHYATRDLSREVNRQMAAMGGTSFWQAVDQWPNGVHEAGDGTQSSGVTPITDIELKDVCLATPAAAAALDLR
ncbi:hypothetical protein BU15DRAFT_63433 [Melanogaster broomeanus]|nr:hypothetical protein BU15DRAFT_63433 [Melanogaster broomeanus]